MVAFRVSKVKDIIICNTACSETVFRKYQKCEPVDVRRRTSSGKWGDMRKQLPCCGS